MSRVWSILHGMPGEVGDRNFTILSHYESTAQILRVAADFKGREIFSVPDMRQEIYRNLLDAPEKAQESLSW